MPLTLPESLRILSVLDLCRLEVGQSYVGTWVNSASASTLTPPVALACFAAAPIAKETGFKISLWAVRIALAGFVIPFMAVYNPALMMQGDNLWMTAYMLVKTVLAVGLWGMASTGYLQQKMPIWERLLSFAAGALLVVALPLTDEIGFVLGVLIILQHVWRSRHVGPAIA